MEQFTVRWRSVRKHREYAIAADADVGGCIGGALLASSGMQVWQAGTIWKCPGCEDRTLRTEEFLEGVLRAAAHLEQRAAPGGGTEGAGTDVSARAREWLQRVAATLFGCERDRVYLSDESGRCSFAGARFVSRI